VTEVWHEVFVIILFFRSVLVVLLLFRRAYAVIIVCWVAEVRTHGTNAFSLIVICKKGKEIRKSAKAKGNKTDRGSRNKTWTGPLDEFGKHLLKVWRRVRTRGCDKTELDNCPA